jgi:hypothetical protein
VGVCWLPLLPHLAAATMARCTVGCSRRARTVPCLVACFSAWLFSQEDLAKDLRVGNRVLLSDGLLELVVEGITGDVIACRQGCLP